jgi:hypothetical protein
MVCPPSSSKIKLISRCCCRSDSCFRSPFPFLVIHSLLPSAFCFICYRYNPKHFLAVVHVSAPPFILRIHVYLSLNYKVSHSTIIAFSRNLHSTSHLIKPPIIHLHHASTLHHPTLHLIKRISPENLNLHPMPNTAPTI